MKCFACFDVLNIRHNRRGLSTSLLAGAAIYLSAGSVSLAQEAPRLWLWSQQQIPTQTAQHQQLSQAELSESLSQQGNGLPQLAQVLAPRLSSDLQSGGRLGDLLQEASLIVEVPDDIVDALYVVSGNDSQPLDPDSVNAQNIVEFMAGDNSTRRTQLLRTLALLDGVISDPRSNQSDQQVKAINHVMELYQTTLNSPRVLKLGIGKDLKLAPDARAFRYDQDEDIARLGIEYTDVEPFTSETDDALILLDEPLEDGLYQVTVLTPRGTTAHTPFATRLYANRGMFAFGSAPEPSWIPSAKLGNGDLREDVGFGAIRFEARTEEGRMRLVCRGLGCATNDIAAVIVEPFDTREEWLAEGAASSETDNASLNDTLAMSEDMTEVVTSILENTASPAAGGGASEGGGFDGGENILIPIEENEESPG